jgi:class 3 adenylate cyclase
MLLAASHPARVRALVLIHPIARVLRDPDYPWGVSPDRFDAVAATNFDPDGHGEDLDIPVVAPSMVSNTAFRDWWDRAGRRGASPATARRQFAMLRHLDVRSILPMIAAPTLVLQRKDNQFVSPGHSRYVAEHIPNARYVEMPGADHIPWLGDFDALVDEIEEFVTGSRPLPEPHRLLATVLFTDIVDSTAHASTMGDRAWHDRLDAHDAAVRRQLERFGGREIKTTGDGFLVTFDSPARSVQCGRAIRDSARQLGIEVRVGAHIGEIDLHREDIRGMTVNIAARVAGLAAAGEVLVTRTITDLVAGSGMEFTDRGECELKGVAGTWRLFSVRS